MKLTSKIFLTLYLLGIVIFSSFSGTIANAANQYASYFSPSRQNVFNTWIQNNIISRKSTLSPADYTSFIERLSSKLGVIMSNANLNPKHRNIYGYIQSEVNTIKNTRTTLASSGTPSCITDSDKVAYYYYYNPDVKAAKVEPIAHWNDYGMKEGRKSCWSGVQTVVAGNASGGSASTDSTKPIPVLSAAELAEQKKVHDSYFAIYDIVQARPVDDEKMYNKVKMGTLSTEAYHDSLDIVTRQGFRQYYDPTDKNNCWSFPVDGKKCFNPFSVSESKDPGYYDLNFGERTFGHPIHNGNPYTGPNRDQFMRFNPVDSDELQQKLKKFKVYLPKGTMGFHGNLKVPKYTRYAFALRIGNPPVSSRKLTPGEYCQTMSTANESYYRTDMDRLLAGEEVIISAAPGGDFFFPEHNGYYKYSNQGTPDPKTNVRKKLTPEETLVRNPLTLKEGQWLYITQLENGEDRFDRFSYDVYVESNTYRSEYPKIQWDDDGNPRFTGFVNSNVKNDPYAGGNPKTCPKSEREVTGWDLWLVDRAKFNEFEWSQRDPGPFYKAPAK